ncbi:hypothetical protein NDU88_007864 [Pleurodeles waltl]|uniref:Uncharacterized protein n=1 Tax=Pleurodeles waltl TaxID=8319 RepID=A0AAV7RQP0_PLEWA|nr:hypothetical protein NDU88_007864 [Pleurodeles waltl]
MAGGAEQPRLQRGARGCRALAAAACLAVGPKEQSKDPERQLGPDTVIQPSGQRRRRPREDTVGDAHRMTCTPRPAACDLRSGAPSTPRKERAGVDPACLWFPQSMAKYVAAGIPENMGQREGKAEGERDLGKYLDAMGLHRPYQIQ